MEPHAVPRQITTFEFKLIGFLTLKQFAYLAVFAVLAVIAFFLGPFDLARYIGAGVVFGIGVFFAFFKYNERSIDVWIKNLIIKLFSSSQYYYKKDNEAPSFLSNVTSDNSVASLHIDAQNKLTHYLSTSPLATHGALKPTMSNQLPTNNQQTMGGGEETEEEKAARPVDPNDVKAEEEQNAQEDERKDQHETENNGARQGPAFSGYVKNNKELPIPNILVYIKDQEGNVARILKTDTHGLFSTNRPLDDGSYKIEPKDKAGRFFFDTMSIDPHAVQQPLVIHSKEVL